MAQKYKAVYKGSVSNKYDKRYYTQVWEYRGHDYTITVPTGWECSTDYIYSDMRQAEQHRREQEAIDRTIESVNEPVKPATNQAQEGLDLFFAYVDGEL